MLNPFIPQAKAKAVIIDGRAEKTITDSLEKLNIKVLKTIKCKDVDESISYHPDIVMHPINHNTVIIAPNVYDFYEEELNSLGIKAIKGETNLEKKYPRDIAYNVARLKGAAIHNFKHTDEKLKFYLKKENLEFININQGYSKCSLSIVDETSGITADKYMCKSLTEIGYDILLINPGHIYLEKQNYGFIGGATGNLSHNTILFTGSLKDHPDCGEIISFINKKNLNMIFLSSSKIVDVGTIMTLSLC